MLALTIPGRLMIVPLTSGHVAGSEPNDPDLLFLGVNDTKSQ